MEHATIWRYKCLWWMIFAMISLFFISYATAHDKVAVIPLMKEAPLEPYAPLAAVSPLDSAYSIGTYVVLDRDTGLYWQKKDDNTTRSWYGAWDYCQDMALNVGSGPAWGPPVTDWRLPTVDELMSIVDYETYNPAINETAFPETNQSQYWSATTSAGDSGEAWFISFSGGGGSLMDKPSENYVRCVRGFFARDSTFRNNGNGTVTDLATGLTWQRQDDNLPKEWTMAVSYCQALSFGGKTDWRLPTIRELASIVDYRVNDPAIDSGAFPGTKGGIDPTRYWSATTSAGDSGEARCVYFGNGGIYQNSKSATLYVRCVRRLSDPHRI